MLVEYGFAEEFMQHSMEYMSLVYVYTPGGKHTLQWVENWSEVVYSGVWSGAVVGQRGAVEV